jgi:hypothetical protein
MNCEKLASCRAAMKFGRLLAEQRGALAVHIAAESFVDYETLKTMIDSGLQCPDEPADLEQWRADFCTAYSEQVRRVKAFLEGEALGGAKKQRVPLEVLVSFIELNKAGLDKITKKYDKINSYLHVRCKLRATGCTGPQRGTAPTSAVPCEHMRMQNAIVYARELEPLAMRALVRSERGLRALRASLALLALVLSALYAACSHSSRAELYGMPGVAGVQMPWHASIILGAGWPFAMLAWFSGHLGIAPGSPLQLLLLILLCVAGGAAITLAAPPPVPASGLSWRKEGDKILKRKSKKDPCRNTYVTPARCPGAAVREVETHRPGTTLVSLRTRL